MPNNIITAALEPILKCHRQQQIRKKITLLWTALGSTGLLYALIRHKQGWDHPHAFTTFITLWITGTLILWIQHRRTRLSLREVARRIEQEHPKLEAALITSLDQQPDPKSGDYHLLQTRVIREALENNLKEPWDQPFHIQLFFTGVLRFASLLIVA
ncbi:MAG: hypothetical protein P8J66_02880, partial [Verrucomicrobiota bacterium]|nr:hypothetical protein [Verrucomicrobiota bacterium]